MKKIKYLLLTAIAATTVIVTSTARPLPHPGTVTGILEDQNAEVQSVFNAYYARRITRAQYLSQLDSIFAHANSELAAFNFQPE